MTTAFDWLPWLPGVLNYAEWIVAGTLYLAVPGAAIGLVPLGKGWAAFAVTLVAGLSFGFLELHNARSAANEFTTFKADAAKAIAKKQVEADIASQAATTATQAALDAQGKTYTVYQTKVVHDTPSACLPSAADRDASRGVRALYEGAATLGAQGGKKPGAAVPAATPGAGP